MMAWSCCPKIAVDGKDGKGILVFEDLGPLGGTAGTGQDRMFVLRARLSYQVRHRSSLTRSMLWTMADRIALSSGRILAPRRPTTGIGVRSVWSCAPRKNAGRHTRGTTPER